MARTIKPPLLMDQFSAHLDRGWDLISRGDAQGAEQSARRALELDAQSPEAYNLLGFACTLHGEFEEAVEHYRQAVALDDSYLEALLNAAEVYLHPLGDFEEAVALCDQALEYAENDEETLDALLLKFDALLGMNELDEARALCAQLPSGPFENPLHQFLIGRALQEIGEPKRAAELLEEAVRAQPQNPEAFHYLGMAREELGDPRQATEAFLKVRALDLELPAPPWAYTQETFRRQVVALVEGLPDRLRAYVHPKELYIGDVPGVELIVDGVDPRAALCLTPLGPERTDTRLFVYQRNVERLAGSLDQVESVLLEAITHEVEELYLSPDSPLFSKDPKFPRGH
ncbi:MAG: tetratricopeptide repeat protein [Polyangiaceae bacterium]|nr:tetratricopeptide repeat protein [Polyangiaceae bacterium]MCW5791123.1 tetratricopeptide repeat protein [Polyangiaceae bacterium]